MSKIRLHGSSSGYTEIAPVAASGNNTLTLPNDGTIISKDAAGAVGVTSVHTTKITNTGQTVISGDIKSTDDDFFIYSYKGGTDGQVRSGIQFDSSNQRMEFYTGTNERMRLETNGDLKYNSGYGSVATAFGVRAWVNFNGTNSGLSGAGNVTSVTDNGTGDFTINFTIDLVDDNYCVAGWADNWETTNNDSYGLVAGYSNTCLTAADCRIVTTRMRFDVSSPTKKDFPHTCVSMIR